VETRWSTGRRTCSQSVRLRLTCCQRVQAKFVERIVISKSDIFRHEVAVWLCRPASSPELGHAPQGATAPSPRSALVFSAFRRCVRLLSIPRLGAGPAGWLSRRHYRAQNDLSALDQYLGEVGLPADGPSLPYKQTESVRERQRPLGVADLSSAFPLRLRCCFPCNSAARRGRGFAFASLQINDLAEGVGS
jgi:hypothetical protein